MPHMIQTDRSDFWHFHQKVKCWGGFRHALSADLDFTPQEQKPVDIFFFLLQFFVYWFYFFLSLRSLLKWTLLHLFVYTFTFVEVTTTFRSWRSSCRWSQESNSSSQAWWHIHLAAKLSYLVFSSLLLMFRLYRLSSVFKTK